MRTLGNVQIDSRSGPINLSVPDKAGFHLDARTRDGEIHSDFSELKVENSDRESKATGSVGNAASHIVLNNEHDAIEIRRTARNSAPEEGVSGRIPAPPQPPKPGRSLPPPKAKVEPTDN
jgi:hypothetical protein